MTTEHAEAPKRDCLCPCHACKKGCACPVAGGCCPNAPKPPEAPKVEEYLRTGDGPDTLYPAKPAPAPEPKQGSEEPIDIEKAFDSATAWIELNAAKLGNIKLDGLTNLAEAFISLRNREKADYAAFVEMNAVFEAVMRAIRGEALSDFDLSHGSVYEANALRAEVERLKQLDIKPSTGSDLLWVEGKHRCAATISNNHLWQVEDEAEVLRAQLAARARKEGEAK